MQDLGRVTRSRVQGEENERQDDLHLTLVGGSLVRHLNKDFCDRNNKEEVALPRKEQARG